MKYFFLPVIIFCTVWSANAQESVMYRLQLKDKGNTPYSISRPEEFLSSKAIERRNKQGLAVDETDLPIAPAYFEALAEVGADVRAYSKWVKTIVVNIPDADVLKRVSELPFVESMRPVWKGDLSSYEAEDYETMERVREAEPISPEEYGDALTQIQLHKGLFLHDKGYKGSGITIAVIDAGFRDVDIYPDFLDRKKIVGVKNFTHQIEDPFRSPQTHGSYVLSCMLANNPGAMIGTAPEANFYLFKTEVNGEEYPVEEDYWVSALEYADSLGVDIVTTSLGYILFDDPLMNHTWEELDGYTVPASRAASMAAGKGLLVFHAAGNEGAGAWEKVSIPADARNIVTVGAVDRDSIRANFSSGGYIVDDRLKPDVMAVGQQTCVFSPTWMVTTSRGTSFATPVLAGLGACLWEALPNLTSFEMLKLLMESADRFTDPDPYYGYGIPNMEKAYLRAKPETGIVLPAAGNTYTGQAVRLSVYSITGALVLEREAIVSNPWDISSSLPKGIYIARMRADEHYSVCKFIVQK